MDASDPKQVRQAQKEARIRERLRQDVIRNLMSGIAGRSFIYDLLNGCHVFGTSFALNGLQMAFNEGERNVGLKLLNDIMQAAPDSYPLMMREANERHTSSEQSRGETSVGGTEDQRDSGDDDRGGPDRGPGSNGGEAARDPNAPDPFGYYKAR